MARGRFGRRRSGSSNLATLVASLLREQRAAEDRAIFDAYQNGGMYKGQKVTDARILAYMKGRRDGFDQADPLWDEWNNRIIQTDFSIGEQKIGLKFKEGKVGAGAVAAFYREKLKSIPKDSAFYREVAGRAADWAKSAAGAARGAARGRASAGLREKLNKTIYDAADYEALELALTQYARAQGIIAGTQTLTDADATALRDMFDRGIFVGEEQLTFDAYQEASVGYYKNLNTQVDIQVKLGNQGIEARNKRDKFLTKTLVRLNTIDERSQYEMARENWIEASEAAAGDPYAQEAADKRYLELLTGIQTNAASDLSGTDANDPEFVGGLVNEINAITTGKATGPTVADLMSNTGEGVVTSDAEDSANAAAAKMGDLKLLESGKAYFGQQEVGEPLKVIQWDGPSSLGLDDSLQPSLTKIAGQNRVVYLKGEEVTVSTIQNAFTKELVDQSTLTASQLRAGIQSGEYAVVGGASLGYVFKNPATGKTQYGVKDANGVMQFTDTNPWADEFGQGYVTGLTDNLTILSGDVVDKGNNQFMPVYNKPIDMLNLDPLLADSTVVPKDLLALTAQGIKDFSPEDVESYRARLQQREQSRVNALSNRDLGISDSLGVGADHYDASVSRGGDRALAQQLAAASNVLRTAFATDRLTNDKPFVPPAPVAPKPIVPAPAKPPVLSPPKAPAPKPPTSVKGDVRPEDSADPYNDDGTGFSKDGSYRPPTIGSGQLGGGGR